MAWLCRMCRTEVEGPECEYCAGPAVEVPKLWELKLETKCHMCNAVVITRIDHDRPDILDMGFFDYRLCPKCNTWSNHERFLLGRKPKDNANQEFLDKALSEEMSRDS